MGYMNHGLWLAFKITGVEDHKLGCFIGHVDDISNQPAIVFRRIGCFRHEDKLAGEPVGAEFMHFADIGFEIVFEQTI